MGLIESIGVGLTVGAFGGLVVFGFEAGTVRGEEVIYTSIYHGREIEVVQRDRKWSPDHCFIRGGDLRIEEGELITDAGMLIGIGYTDTCGDCYCVRDYQPNTPEE